MLQIQILDSPVDEDVCGVCGGDGSKCKMKRRALTGKIRAEEGFKKLAIVPKGAMEIRLVFNDNGQVSSLDGADVLDADFISLILGRRLRPERTSDERCGVHFERFKTKFCHGGHQIFYIPFKQIFARQRSVAGPVALARRCHQ